MRNPGLELLFFFEARGDLFRRAAIVIAADLDAIDGGPPCRGAHDERRVSLGGEALHDGRRGGAILESDQLHDPHTRTRA